MGSPHVLSPCHISQALCHVLPCHRCPFSWMGQAAAGGPQANSTMRLGVNARARWFKTLFPLVGRMKTKGNRVQFLPQNVMDAVEKAIKQSTVDLAYEVSNQVKRSVSPSALAKPFWHRTSLAFL